MEFKIKCNECSKPDIVPTKHKLCLECRDNRQIKRNASKSEANCKYCNNKFEYLSLSGKLKWCSDCVRKYSKETLKPQSSDGGL